MSDDIVLQTVSDDELNIFFAKINAADKHGKYESLGALYRSLKGVSNPLRQPRDPALNRFVSETEVLLRQIPITKKVVMGPGVGGVLGVEEISIFDAAKLKLAKLKTWEQEFSKKTHPNFNTKTFVRQLRWVIVIEALDAVKGPEGVATGADPLRDSFNELYERLFPESFCFSLPISDADILFEQTAGMLVNLVTPAQEDMLSLVINYQKQVSTALSPVLQAALVALIVAAVVFAVMAALQIPILGITPLTAFSLVDVIASSAPQIWAIVTPVVVALAALAAGLLPRYSSLKTDKLENVYNKALFFASQPISSVGVVSQANPMHGKRPSEVTGVGGDAASLAEHRPPRIGSWAAPRS